MATIRIIARDRRRGDGTIAHTVRVRAGLTESTRTFTTEKARDQFITRVKTFGPEEALRRLDTGHATRPGTPTIKDWATTCITERDLAEGTARKYRGYLTELAHLADMPLDTVTPDDIRTWIELLKDKGNSAKTITNKHGFIASIYTDATQAGHVHDTPTAHTRLPRSEHHEMTCLTPAQASTIIRLLHPDYRLLARILVTTGLRFGEAAALTPTTINPHNGTVRILEALTKAETGWEYGAPKTPNSIRTVPVTDDIMTDLRPLLLRPPHERIFTTPTGGMLRHGWFWERHWKPVVDLANGTRVGRGTRAAAYYQDIEPAETPLGVRPRIHDCRHTAASWWLSAGVDIHVVKAMLGHKSITTTIDTYGHLLPGVHDQARAGMTAMAGLLA